jgi:hypothetical protein
MVCCKWYLKEITEPWPRRVHRLRLVADRRAGRLATGGGVILIFTLFFKVPTIGTRSNTRLATDGGIIKRQASARVLKDVYSCATIAVTEHVPMEVVVYSVMALPPTRLRSPCGCCTPGRRSARCAGEDGVRLPLVHPLFHTTAVN